MTAGPEESGSGGHLRTAVSSKAGKGAACAKRATVSRSNGTKLRPRTQHFFNGSHLLDLIWNPLFGTGGRKSKTMMRQLLPFAFLCLQVTDTLEGQGQGQVFLEALVKKDLLPANSAGTVVISDQAKEESTLLLSLLQEETHGPTAAYDLADFENQDAKRIPGQTFVTWLGNQDSFYRSVSALESHQSPESKYLFLLEYNADLESLRNSLETTW